MPIYAYKCDSCGHAKDVLQKMSDPVLTACPSCGKNTFSKQVTAAGFQLKGSGWYVTDFRDGGKASGSKPADGAASGTAAGTGTGATAVAPAADGANAKTPPAASTPAAASPSTPSAAPPTTGSGG